MANTKTASLEKFITSYGDEHDVFSLEVVRGINSEPFVTFVRADEADVQARRLSNLIPGLRIRLMKMERVKAAYIKGERRTLRDFKEYYDNLSPEEYKATKIKDSQTAEWV